MLFGHFCYTVHKYSRICTEQVAGKWCTKDCMPFFYVLLTVHLSTILVINQLNAQILLL